MSERADDDVRGEQRRAARQPKQQQQQQIQQGEGSTAMATVGERRSLPSPEIALGQPWSEWIDAAKLYGSDGAESEESLKECGKNREAMRLCRDDMPIFGQFPAQDDFYLVMCSHCNQVVKPQAFQAHYERRHSSSSKPPSSSISTSTFPLSTLLNSFKAGGTGGVGGAGRTPNSNGSSSNSKIPKLAKEKLAHGIHNSRPILSHKVLPDKTISPGVKVEKAPVKVLDTPPKLIHASPSSTTVSSKPSLTSIPKAALLAPGPIPNGKVLLSALDKKQENSTSYKRQKRISEREFNADFHCGVLDLVTRKPCTRSLTCKTHSLSQRRAVQGRRKRFDTLLAEHKSKAREKETQRTSEHPQQPPLLRDPHPSPSRFVHDLHQGAPGNGASEAKPSLPSKPRPHNQSLPRPHSSSHPCGNAQGEPGLLQDSPHPSTVPLDGPPRLSSDEGENEEKEDGADKLDCHYSSHHPRPAAFCTFGSHQLGRSCFWFNRRLDRVRCALSAMVDRHINTHLWKKIPPAPEALCSPLPHRTSTSLQPVPSCSGSATSFPCSASLTSSPVLVSPPYAQSLDSKAVLSYGTTLNARVSPGGGMEPPAYGAPVRQVSLWPQVPSGHSAVPSSSRSPKSKPSSKPFRSRDSSGTVLTSAGVGSGKKRKSSSPLPAHPVSSLQSSSSSSSSSSGTFKKNCAATPGTQHHLLMPPSATHITGHNSAPAGRTNSVGVKHEQPSRGPSLGSPAESIKRMSVVMNSSDSTLSLGPFVHQTVTEHTGNSHGGSAHGSLEHRLVGKRRKMPLGSAGMDGGSRALGGGGGGAPGSGRSIKLSKAPTINNIHGKHGRPIPGLQGLPNNSFIQQPKARP
ncbi:ataxin-7-like [Brienomyrus brachyistius]|uniref:ataxin-7-like n=1 Tax=Brienomyrus brachyistius TaxID=42636 RepID=UPI0020B32893|nr:ataxin-7-like [Brienomyrus brachyistius]XP_048874270.1 ataxin-7-like [Brienomyrus brachyistius]